MQLNYKSIGLRIKDLRKRKKLTQERLAERVKLSVTYISMIETASKHISLEKIVMIADALDVTVDRLLYGNQSHDKTEYEPELLEIISDCSNYERKVIYEAISALKNARVIGSNGNDIK